MPLTTLYPIDWHCQYTPSDFCLASFYTVFTAIAGYQFIMLLRRSTGGSGTTSDKNQNEKNVQKIFLMTLTLLSVIRAVNFFMQPVIIQGCTRDIISMCACVVCMCVSCFLVENTRNDSYVTRTHPYQETGMLQW